MDTQGKERLLTSKEMANFVADGFLRFDAFIPDAISCHVAVGVSGTASLDSNRARRAARSPGAFRPIPGD